MRRNWWPCRVCGAEHTNPMSSSICRACGTAESNKRRQEQLAEHEAYEASAFGQFMSLPEDDRWRLLFEHLEAAEDAA